MKKNDWLGVIIIFTLLYLLSRAVNLISVLFLFEDIILMVVILFIAFCFFDSGSSSRDGANLDNAYSEFLRMEWEILTHEKKLDFIDTQYYELDKSIVEIAGELGVSITTVRKYIDELEGSKEVLSIPHGQENNQPNQLIAPS